MSVSGFIVLAIIVVLAGYGVALYNSLVSLKHSVSKAWSNIDVLLKQRHDELPHVAIRRIEWQLAFKLELLGCRKEACEDTLPFKCIDT